MMTANEPGSGLGGVWREGGDCPQEWPGRSVPGLYFGRASWALAGLGVSSPLAPVSADSGMGGVGADGLGRNAREIEPTAIVSCFKITLTNWVSVSERLVYTPHPEDPGR